MNKSIVKSLAKKAEVDEEAVARVLDALGFESVKEKLFHEGGKELLSSIKVTDLKLAARFARSDVVV